MKITIYPEIPQKLKKEIAKYPVFCEGYLKDGNFVGKLSIPDNLRIELEKYTENVVQVFSEVQNYILKEKRRYK
jgi:hypothetical protein